MSEVQKCEDCNGTGLALNMAGEPDDCKKCGGNTVVPVTLADKLRTCIGFDKGESKIISDAATEIESLTRERQNLRRLVEFLNEERTKDAAEYRSLEADLREMARERNLYVQELSSYKSMVND